MSRSVPDETTTLLFCRSQSDGSIGPDRTAEDAHTIQNHFQIGQKIADRYFLQRQLGQGSMGRVYLARDLRLERPVAIKVIAHQHPQSRQTDQALEREARLGASLTHRGIAAVFDFGFHENKSYTVFEYVEGETLRELLKRRGKLALPETINIVRDLAAALDFAHLHGVIHRDLKPENVCVTKGGDLKILDFGIARELSRDAAALTYSGTPAYSSPEQAACRVTGARSDQYALALMAFEMLTGRRPFSAALPTDVLQQQIQQPPPQPRTLNPELPEPAERALLRGLEKQPDDRFGTCQEFARELGQGAERRGARHVVQTPPESRMAFYVAHTAEESQLARRLGDRLNALRFRNWLYGRDAIPGVPFARQSNAAIEQSQAVIVLISRTSIRSADLDREIGQAHRIGCPLLPFLVDMSREEFEKLSPAWRQMLGPSPLIECHRSDGIDAVVNRITRAAASLHIRPDPGMRPEMSEPAPRYAGQPWVTDANQIDIPDLDRVLFRNDTIDDFLNRRHRHFISATKGFGKTLLLTAKRQILSRTVHSEHQNLVMIPEGRPFLDFMSELRSLSRHYESPLSSLSNTKRLWSAALRISAISHHPDVIDGSEASEVAFFPDRIQRWLSGGKIQPTVAFKELTNLRVSELNRLIDRTENFLDQKMRQIHGGLCFFIDKVDQAIRHLSRDAWIAVQAGLIEAAWETMNANSHLKIFASIRQEAFTSYQSDIKANLFSATTSLSYTDEELRALLDQLARCYEGCQSFADFLGHNVVRHGRRPNPEDSFQFVRRHTCGRPRDFVAIASEISSKRSSLSEKQLRDIVKQTSATVLVSNLFDEVRVFLNCLDDADARFRFLAELPANILEKTDAVHACEVFNGLAPGSLEHFGENSGDIFHPFQDLYLAGLLGVVEFDPEPGHAVQRFRRPHDPLMSSASALPESKVFLMHPALDNFIRALRTRQPFLQYQHVPVGENLLWEPHFPAILQIEKQLAQIEDRHFLEAAHQVIRWAQAALNSGHTRFTRMEIESSAEWTTLTHHPTVPAASDAILWLHELLDHLGRPDT